MIDRRALASLLTLLALANACARKAPPAADAATTPAPSPAARKYQCPMHPQVISDAPGKCPICRMELVPVSEVGAVATPSAAAVRLSPEGVRAAGIATVAVERATLAGAIRTVGTIEPDETKLTRVAARVAGRIEKLYADYTGQVVAAGAPLYAVYSPELVATQRELLLAIENRKKLAGASADTVRSADDLVSAARERLRLWSVAPREISAIEAGGEPLYAVAFSSPRGGTVLEKKVVLGEYVTEGQELYLLADLT